jgi:LuxR family maltose regulon positive regulatory protein
VFGNWKQYGDLQDIDRKDRTIIPRVQGGLLVYFRNDQEQKVTVGTPSWFAWLETASTFSFVSNEGHFTARKERSAQQRGGWYWKAYRKQDGRLFSRYLGKSEALTPERLQTIAAALSAAPRTITSPHTGVSSGSSSPSIGNPPDPLLAVRLHPPHLRMSLVPRSHLVNRLHESMARPLTLISAPAGYGKTTLLAQWLAESKLPSAWLSLETRDNDPVRFLSYLLAAVRTRVPDLDLNIPALLQTPQAAPLERVFAVLASELLERQTGDFVLVLDDYQVIEAAPVHQALTFFLDHLPPQLHVVVATRTDPPLPLARLRARGQLTELRAADLRLSDDESKTFFQSVMGLALSPQAVLAIQSRAEGWIAGLQLAALSLRDREDIPTFLAAFTGSHRFVLDYFSEEVLSRLPAPQLSFLLHTSILERLSGSLCDAVTQREDGQSMLETLERANLFVVPLDDERHWYRYHHLFAELLQNRLQRTQPELITELHWRASLWYAQYSHPAEAVQHALAANDFELAARLIEHSATGFLKQGQTSLLLNWLNAFPEALVCTNPWLCIWHACALHLLDHPEEAEARIRDAERVLATETASEQMAIRGLAAIIRANLARYAGDLERALSFAREAWTLLPEEPPEFRSTALSMIAHAYLISGDATPETEQQVQAAVSANSTSGYQLMYFRSLILRARLQMLQGQLRAAAVTCEQAGQATPKEVLQVLSASSIYCFTLGDLLREWNRLDEAEHLLTQGMEQIDGKRSVYGDDVLNGYLVLARLYQARGMYDQAIATLDAFLHLAEAHQYPAYPGAMAEALRAQIALAQSRLATAVAWADTSGLSCQDSELPYLREQEYLTLARVYLARGRAHPAGPWLQKALELLRRLRVEAEAKARGRSVLEILIVQTLVIEAQGRRSEALSTLREVLQRAEPESYIRLFIDEGAPMQALLHRMQERDILPEYVATLLRAFGSQRSPETAPAFLACQELTEPLTQREREVLQLIGAGASNREIACRLVVSVNTVKRHVHNLCRKLGARSRTQAIARARGLQLL